MVHDELKDESRVEACLRRTLRDDVSRVLGLDQGVFDLTGVGVVEYESVTRLSPMIHRGLGVVALASALGMPRSGLPRWAVGQR